ncbi:50S ribosomal protein L29 [Anoxybacter fermentans]|uniref:Large ribosomal subunit protein uL29 n=1 Tax=Anoxybacter fermentans TaxID=1323375 RepID=A0A3Q9HSM8_9FIRM|nr:50S ribosomal protein L29 [Anoxybacter fermentans]AZR74726.1 50S ribosomal protein L29 [Anoxybacter fermentans]
MKADKLREMTIDELKVQLKELKEELFNLRFQHATAQLDNPLRIREVRRTIARVKTIIREKELGINA